MRKQAISINLQGLPKEVCNFDPNGCSDKPLKFTLVSNNSYSYKGVRVLVYQNLEFGWVFMDYIIRDKVMCAICMYEPHNFYYISDKSCWVFYGHETITVLFSDGVIQTIHTR
jgi:hypothetical protein